MLSFTNIPPTKTHTTSPPPPNKRAIMVIAANHQHHPLISQTNHYKDQKQPTATPTTPPTTPTTPVAAPAATPPLAAIPATTPAATTTEAKEQEEKLIDVITKLYDAISKLPSLDPSPQVNSLFSSLVSACIPPYPSLTLSSLSSPTLAMRSHLISLCSAAESSLELHYSSLLHQLSLPSSSLLPHLPRFPYFSNYLSLSLLESSLISSHLHHPPPLVAFLGSGPLPLSSIILASRHFPSSSFHNFDIDPAATAKASALLSADKSLASRMEFVTADVSTMGERLRAYGVVFLAALVGLEKEEKVAVVEHLAKHMSPTAMLVVRSARGARMFLYPVIEPGDLKGFEVLSVHHPDDEVINSVIVARKVGAMAGSCKCCEAKKKMMKHGVVIEELPTGA